MIRSIPAFFFSLIFFSCSFSVKGQVVANFTIGDTAGCAPLVDYFTNTSTGATSYTWNLGNGTTSTLTNPSGSYVSAGTYTITLTAHNGASSSTHSATINVYAQPTVSFHASDTALCPGVPTIFTSTSIAGSPGPMTYNWNFGDGSASSVTSPTHTYIAAGDFNATLFVTNGKGCINSLSKDPYIHVFSPPSPSIMATSTYICRSPGTATFTNTTTGVGPMAYVWRFGDGTTSALTAPTHHYSVSGVYGVSLIATDADGCIDSIVYPSYITVGGLHASFTPVTNACLNAVVTFTNTSTSHLLSGWDFGDGGTALIDNPVHTYTATGTYSVRLIIYDGTCFDTIIHPVTISHPTGSFTISPARPCPPPAMLTFNASVPPGCTVSWSSLIAGSMGAGTTLSHLFPPLVVYPPMGPADTVGFIDSVTMFITDAFGCKDTIGKRDTVNKLILQINPNDRDTCAPVTANFSLSAFSHVYDAFAEYPYYAFGLPVPLFISYSYPFSIASYSWNFGDGSPLSSSPAPTHVYTTVGGVYDVSCAVTTSNGCTGYILNPANVKVGAPPPTPTATRVPNPVCAGRTMYFTGVPSGVYDGNEWDFGDGGTKTNVLTPQHIYTEPGIYDAYFYTTYNGCKSMGFLMKDTVYAPSAVIDEYYLCIPRNEIAFIDSSRGDDTHLWQFGDGTTSTVSNIVHAFPTLGNYTVTLTTYNIASGCRDTSSILMELEPVATSVVAFSGAICRDMADTFAGAALSTDSSFAVKYRWFFSGLLTDSISMTYPYDTLGHVLHTVGVNPVMLIITDNHKCFDTATATVLVAKPVDSFNFTPPSGCVPLSVHFTDHSTPTPGTSLVSYFWNLGDGDTTTTITPSISHAYILAGGYSIKEIVTDNIGCADTFTSHTSVVANSPSASFHAGIPTICARSSVTFTNTSSGFTSSLWFFGDGDTSTTTSPVHVYTTSGIYSVTLVVTGSFGCKDTMVVPNYIAVNPSPTASFNMSDSFAVCSPFGVNFTNTSTGASVFLWTFGDGTSSGSLDPSDVYITPGYYRVKLSAYNSFGCLDTAIGHVNLFGYSGAFTYTPTAGCPPLVVHFTGVFTSVAHVVWDFDDGATSASSSDTITHVYTSIGDFMPKLILTDSALCTSASFGADTIKVGNLVPGFTITPNPVCQGNLITFHDTSSGGVAPITTWAWTFGPGITSSSSTPTHVYSLAGTYTVTLTVTNAVGCTGTVTRSVVVNSVPPAITGPPVICLGAPTAFTDSVTGGIWSSGSTGIATIGSSTGIAAGVSTGTTTITYSLGSGCTVTKLVSVSAVSSVISGSSVVCIGSTITLTDPAPSGMWTSAIPGIATVGSASGIVTGISSGIDTIIYTAGSCPPRKAVTVNPLPSITGTTHICIGTTATLNATPAGGTWSSSNPAIATVGSSSGVVSGIAYGTAVISYTFPGTGCRAVTTVFINHPSSPVLGLSFVCIGGSITLSDTVAGGTWSSGDTAVATIGSVSGVVTGITVGTAPIHYNVGGCNVSAMVSVNVPSAIMGPNQACIGATIALTDAATGGTWTSSNPLVASVGTSSGIVTGLALGSVTITYSLGTACTTTMPVTVNPLPSGISGVGNICVGATAVLHDTASGGAWSSSNSAIVSVGSTGHIIGVSGGADTIYYTVSTGCAATLFVSVNSVPPISGLSNMCAYFDTIIIHDADTSAYYSSTLVTVVNLGLGVAKVIANAAGVATIVCTNSLGCFSTTTITVNPLPAGISGTLNICMGATTTLHDTSSAGSWSASGTGVITVGSSTGLVTGISAGAAHVTYTIPTGCWTYATVNVYAFPSADTITGPSDLCVGQLITLTDTALGGSWTSSSTSKATVSGGVVTGVSAGSDTITCSVTNVCGTVRTIMPITIYPAVSAGVILGNDSVCAGSTITLADTSSGGTWSSTSADATVSAGIVTGVTQGTDTIAYIVANPACMSKAIHLLTINPLPVAGSITGNANLCVGDTAVLTETVTGGLWNQSNAIATLVPVTGGGIVFRSTAAGIDTVYYAVTNVCGTIDAKHIMIVNAQPTVWPIQGPSVMCVNSNVMLTDSIPGGTWWSNIPAIAEIGSATGQVMAMLAGNDTITYTVSNSCGVISTSMPVTVDPLPVAGSITGNTTLCVGDSVTLRDTATGGVWGLGNAAATIRGSVTVTGVSAGTDTLSYSVTNNCGTTVATELITIDPAPNGIVITADGHALSVPSGYASYQWTLDGAPVPGATLHTYTAVGSGIYGVIIGNTLGCLFVCPPVDIAGCSVSDIQVYPNPATSVVYIQWCNAVTARLSCMDGKLIRVMENVTEVDVSYLPNGIYTLTIFDTTGKKLVSKRITKLAP